MVFIKECWFVLECQTVAALWNFSKNILISLKNPNSVDGFATSMTFGLHSTGVKTVYILFCLGFIPASCISFCLTHNGPTLLLMETSNCLHLSNCCYFKCVLYGGITVSSHFKTQQCEIYLPDTCIIWYVSAASWVPYSTTCSLCVLAAPISLGFAVKHLKVFPKPSGRLDWVKTHLDSGTV